MKFYLDISTHPRLADSLSRTTFQGWPLGGFVVNLWFWLRIVSKYGRWIPSLILSVSPSSQKPLIWSDRTLMLKRQEKNASENVVCWSLLLRKIAWHYWRIKYRSKQRGPRTDCSYRSSLIWVHTVCHRGFLNISADEKSRRLLLRLAH